MFKTKEYFEGNVKSIGFKSNKGRASVGVMAPGEYEFGTENAEHISIISGEMGVKLPNENDFKMYKHGEKFVVEPGVKFLIKIPVETAYLCLYM